MKAILDTHTLLWLVDRPEKLPKRVSVLCADGTNKLFISIASFWELSIKVSLGKINLEDKGLYKLKQWCDENSVDILPITLAHCDQVKQLTFHHRDPFDRLIIAQAICDRLSVITIDEHFPKYNINVIWR